MDPQILNFFANLEDDVKAFVLAFLQLQDRFQEAYDRGIDAALPTLDFSEAGLLDHLSEAKLIAAFQAYTALNATMTASDRENFTRLYGVIR